MKTDQHARPDEIAAWAWAYTPQGRAALDTEAAAETKRLLALLDLGHVYVVEFTSGIVKVGKSVDPAARIATHRLLAQAHGGDVRDSWVSPIHYCSGQTERELIAYCAHIGQLVVGREYFRAPFAEVRSRASLLSRNRFTPDVVGWPWQEADELLGPDAPEGALP